jgi:hypothetical protein
VKLMGSNRTRILLVALALAYGLQGCGIFNPEKGGHKPDPLPPMPPMSPQDVIDNMAYAYNHFEYEQNYEPLIRSDFTFIFNEDDVTKYPDTIPQEGWWGAPEEMMSARHMLDKNFVPEDPRYTIDSIQLLLKMGDLEPSNLQGVPKGTLEAYVAFDLEVQASGGALTVQVQSRPLFFFTPDDSTSGQGPWRLWKIKDGPYDDESG